MSLNWLLIWRECQPSRGVRLYLRYPPILLNSCVLRRPFRRRVKPPLRTQVSHLLLSSKRRGSICNRCCFGRALTAIAFWGLSQPLRERRPAITCAGYWNGCILIATIIVGMAYTPSAYSRRGAKYPALVGPRRSQMFRSRARHPRQRKEGISESFGCLGSNAPCNTGH